MRTVFYYFCQVSTPESCWPKRNMQVIPKYYMYICSYIHTISDEHFLSVDNAQKFLREMEKSSGSKCNCLPGECQDCPLVSFKTKSKCLLDCELFDIQHSVSTTNFMWVILFMLSVSTFFIPIKRPCDSRNLNLNPLCMLETGTLPKLWTNRVID